MPFSIFTVINDDRDLVSEDKEGELKMEDDKERMKMLTNLDAQATSGEPKLSVNSILL